MLVPRYTRSHRCNEIPELNPTEPQDDTAIDAFMGKLMQHRHALYAFIAKQLINPADVEDVYQKTSIVLWKKLEQFDPNGSFFHWACGIAFNEVRNFLTVHRRNKLYFDNDLLKLIADEAVEEDAVTAGRLAALNICMSRLSERQQEIMRRCYSGTDSITDVAASLGRERGAFYKQLARLKEKLHGCIQKRMAVEGVPQ